MNEIDMEKKVANNQNHRSRLTLVIVRHGERLDYAHRAAGKNWCGANPAQPWNPPLTQRGLSMAMQLGAALREEILPDLGAPPVSAVYTSPFLRCRQTAAAIVQGMSSKSIGHKRSESDRGHTVSSPLKVRVELGLAESINENWYRSWSLPGTDGTWGYKKQEIPHIDPVRDRMDIRALLPVETLLDWKESSDVTSFNKTLHRMMDHEHRSLTTLGRDYSFAGNPPKLENGQLQRSRISETIKILSEEHCNTGESIDKEKEETILLVSHGGIVTQFYVNLTGNTSKNHGVGKYCCFSIYCSDNEAQSRDTKKNNDVGKEKWIPLVVNRVLWSNGKKNDFDKSFDDNT